jgi:hypothetical protein
MINTGITVILKAPQVGTLEWYLLRSAYISISLPIKGNAFLFPVVEMPMKLNIS